MTKSKSNTLTRLKNRFSLQNMNLPARSSIYFTATNLLCKGAAFVFTPLFTRLLSPIEYGEYSLFSSYLSVSIVIASLEMPGGVIMRAFQKEQNFHFLSLISAAILSLIISIPTVLALFISKLITGGGMGFPFAYVLLFLSLSSLSLINLYVSRCKFLYKWIPPFLVSILQSIAAPIISIGLIRVNYFKSLDHVATKIGTGTTVLVITAIFIGVLSVKKAHSEMLENNISLKEALNFIKKTQKFLLKLSLPLLPYYFSIMLISQSDKLLISELVGKSELAKYSVAYSAGISLTAVTSGIMGSLSPWIMRKVRAGELSRIKDALGSIISLAVCSIIIFLSFAPDIFRILAPGEYSNALPVLFISALIPIPLSLSQCMSSVAIAKEKVRGVLLSGLIPAFLSITLNLLFIKSSPLYIPAIITAGGFFTLLAFATLNIRRITGKYLINVNKTFQKLSFLILTATILFSFKDIIFIRTIIALLSFISILYMLKDTVKLLKEKDSSL